MRGVVCHRHACMMRFDLIRGVNVDCGFRSWGVNNDVKHVCAESEVCMEEYTPTCEVCDCLGLLMAALDRLQAHTRVFR